MTLTYESDLDDVSEPAVRHFLRSETARKARIRNTISGAIVCSVVGIFIFRDHSPVTLAVSGVISSLIGAALNYFTYVPTVTRRIRKYMERETQGKLPATTTYRFEENKLACDHLGVTIAFPLSELERVAEDTERLEICFGSIGLCTIPLRAFDSPEEKTAFISKLNSEQADAGNGSHGACRVIGASRSPSPDP
jgi:hypothetical protein